MNYYHRFQTISHLFFFRSYLRWAYLQGVKDLAHLGQTSDFMKKDFSCLLCGVGSEITADEFIRFVLSRNPKAVITIIDLGEKQIASVKRLVREKYKDYSITIREMNALELTKYFPNHSFDWIETDCFIEFFDDKSLKKLLNQWKLLLKKDGFITTRDFVSTTFFSSIIDKFRLWFIKKYLTLPAFTHTKNQLDVLFRNMSLQYISGTTPFPTLRRYTLTSR